MSWKDNLRPCSLGGVRCHVEDRQHQGGKRLVVHEYPKRDKPYIEEMGRATRRWAPNLYVIGDDYMAARDALLRVCERGGVTTYVDFWKGSRRVQVEHFELRESNHQGRYASISVGMIEDGEDLGLTGTIATAVGLSAAASSLAGAAAQAFSLGTSGLAGAASSLASLSGSLRDRSSAVSQASSAVRTATAVGQRVASHFK